MGADTRSAIVNASNKHSIEDIDGTMRLLFSADLIDAVDGKRSALPLAPEFRRYYFDGVDRQVWQMVIDVMALEVEWRLADLADAILIPNAIMADLLLELSDIDSGSSRWGAAEFCPLGETWRLTEGERARWHEGIAAGRKSLVDH
jgi:hypothetical protein